MAILRGAVCAVFLLALVTACTGSNPSFTPRTAVQSHVLHPADNGGGGVADGGGDPTPGP